MNKACPVIKETPDERKTWMQHEIHPLKRLRLHALYLFADHHAHTYSAVARLLGVGRNVEQELH